MTTPHTVRDYAAGRLGQSCNVRMVRNGPAECLLVISVPMTTEHGVLSVDVALSEADFRLPDAAFLYRFIAPACGILRDELAAAKRIAVAAQHLLRTIPCDE